jgi:hypothetical protein
VSNITLHLALFSQPSSVIFTSITAIRCGPLGTTIHLAPRLEFTFHVESHLWGYWKLRKHFAKYGPWTTCNREPNKILVFYRKKEENRVSLVWDQPSLVLRLNWKLSLRACWIVGISYKEHWQEFNPVSNSSMHAPEGKEGSSSAWKMVSPEGKWLNVLLPLIPGKLKNDKPGKK